MGILIATVMFGDVVTQKGRIIEDVINRNNLLI